MTLVLPRVRRQIAALIFPGAVSKPQPMIDAHTQHRPGRRCNELRRVPGVPRGLLRQERRDSSCRFVHRSRTGEGTKTGPPLRGTYPRTRTFLLSSVFILACQFARTGKEIDLTSRPTAVVVTYSIRMTPKIPSPDASPTRAWYCHTHGRFPIAISNWV